MITFEFGAGEDLQSGYVTNMLRADGTETTDPREAIEFVGHVLEGMDAGTWIRWSAEPDDVWTRVRNH